MSQTSRPNPKTRTNILRVLAGSVSPLPGEEIAYRLGMLRKTTREYLLKLYAEGSVQRTRKGKQYLYFLAAPSNVTLEEAFTGPLASAAVAGD